MEIQITSLQTYMFPKFSALRIKTTISSAQLQNRMSYIKWLQQPFYVQF